MKYIITLFLLMVITGVKNTHAQPAGWTGIQTFTVTNNSSSLVTNYQLRLVVNTSALVGMNLMQPNGADIRFGKDCAGTTFYSHFIDSGMNSANTVLWVKIDSIEAADTRTFHLFYGNPTAANTSTFATFNGPFSSTNQVNVASTNTVSNCQRGFRFSPNTPVLVSQFGKKAPDATTRFVTLFNYNTQAIVRQQQVSGPAATYGYSNLSSHVWLNQGQQYVLQLYNGANDMYYYGNSSQINSNLTYFDMMYCNGCTQNTFPSTTLANFHYGVPDFNFYTRTIINPAPTYTTGGGGLVITAQPNNKTICGGDTVTFSITTNPAVAGSYQWQINTGTGWTNLSNNPPYSGVNTGKLHIATTNPSMNAYMYRVVVPAGCSGVGTQNSQAASLFILSNAVTPSVAITSDQPGNIVCKNEAVHFNAIITNGGSNPIVSWRINGATVGANNLDYYTSTLGNGDIVSCILVSDALCRTKDQDTSSLLQMQVVSNPSPVVSKTGNTLMIPAVYSAYQWYKDGAIINGATSNTLVVNTVGNYWVQVIDQNICYGESTPLWVPFVLSLKDHEQALDIKIFPNPTKNLIRVSSQEIYNVHVLNMLGQKLIYSSSDKEISLGKLSNNLYIVEIFNNHNELIKRELIVKE